MQFDLFTFLASLFNFLVLLGVLRIFLFKRVTAAMDARESRIADNWDEAEHEKEEAEQLRRDYEQRMQEADEERDDLLEEARRQIEREKEQGLERAREEVDRRRQDWLEGLQSEKERLFQSVRSEVARATVESTDAALRALAGETLQHQIVATLIDQLSQRQDELAEHIRGRSVEVTTADALSEQEQERVRETVNGIAAAETIDFSTSDRVICGVRMRLGDRELGWSIADHLAKLETDMAELVESR
jgi:F-type H+-transporting ATPase subunit b